VTARIARLVALSLPVLLVCVLASTGGWRVHDGRVERVGPVSASMPAPPVVSPRVAPRTDEVTFVDHLSPSVPWEAWAGLVVLCLLPGAASLVAWSGGRRRRDDTAFCLTGGST
jgi:hypothetical protein